MSKTAKYVWLALLLVVVVAGWTVVNDIRKSTELDGASGNLSEPEVQRRLGGLYKTDFSRTSIDLDLLLSGGVGKDGIPAIDNPEFEPIAVSSISSSTLGVYVENNGDERFYPYNILVWHEIVNDEIGGKKVAVTFCPLCGSAVVFDPTVNGKTLMFGVSGLLHESNLVMYDRQTESFWSQSTGESIVGEHLGIKLNLVAFKLITLEQAKRKHPNTQIMTTNTGYSRNYSSTPYGNYNENEELFFPVSNKDARYPTKEIFYVIRRGDNTIAIRKDGVAVDTQFHNDELGLTITNDDGELEVTNTQDEVVPGYFEMWFSWVNHNTSDSLVWDPAVDS